MRGDDGLSCCSQLTSNDADGIETVVVVGLKAELSSNEHLARQGRPLVIQEPPGLVGGVWRGSLYSPFCTGNHHLRRI
jgi:hypothetical protein